MPFAFQEQRHVQHDQRRAEATVARQEALSLPGDQRMNDRLQPAQRAPVGKDDASKRRSIDRSVAHRVWKSLGDRRDRGTAARHQPVHCRIGVMHGYTQATQHRCGSRLAHTDRTGQAEDLHQRASTWWTRRKSSNGNRGSPSTVK